MAFKPNKMTFIEPDYTLTRCIKYKNMSVGDIERLHEVLRENGMIDRSGYYKSTLEEV